MLSYWFKIRPFYSEENGVDMLHPYSNTTTTTNGSTRQGGASRRSRFDASPGGPCERSAMRTPFPVVVVVVDLFV
ncbi:MAG: hypothetical protein AAFP89_27805 [Bacteroidota bacterium]